jgi:type VI secretion system protein ImpH
MAGPSGRDGVPVTDGRTGSPLTQLWLEPFQFEFFQAVRLIALAETDPSIRAAEPVMRTTQLPYEEHIRFRAHVGHAFPASAISSFAQRLPTEAEPDGTPVPEMTVTFMGLAGTSGVLPPHYTQLLIDRAREKDFGLQDFLDLFNHRSIAQFYRAWEKCHFYVGYESSRRGDGTKKHDRFTQMLLSLVGMGTAGLQGRQAISDEILLYYAGHFSHRPRSAVALEQIVSDAFDVPTEIRQFQGQWMYLRPADQTRLRLGWNNQLGVSAIAGKRVWGIENKVRVRLGALSYEEFQRFMPGGTGYVSLGQIVRSFVGPAFDFDLAVVLSRDEIPRCQLSLSAGMRLGWNTWVFRDAPTGDVGDAVFPCEGMPSH